MANWETDDSDIVSFFQNKPNASRSSALERALKVGVVASSTVSTAEKVDYIQREFALLQTRFESGLDKTFSELESRFQDVFGERGEFAKILQDTFGDRGRIAKGIFDPSIEGTPLYRFVSS